MTLYRCIPALMVLLSWDHILHNCDGSVPPDVIRYNYRVAMRYAIGGHVCTVCDDEGGCWTYDCIDYNPFAWTSWRSVAVPSAACPAGAQRCSVQVPEIWEPASGEVSIYEVEAEDKAANQDCGLLAP